MERIFLLICVLLVVYEIVTLGNTAPGDTISEIVWRLSERWGVLKFLAGVLCGHFFWPKSG